MFRVLSGKTSPVVPRLARTTRRLVLGTTLVGSASATYYYGTTTTVEQRRGLQRQAFFWSRLLPIVADYYWHFGSRSPRQWLVQHAPFVGFWSTNKKNEKKDTNDTNDDATATRERRLDQLHTKHAPAVLQVMLDLKGLYVKLGQVLSVTALPIPEMYRVHFRTLQSDVPGHEEFETVVQHVLRDELQTDDLSTIFAYIDPEPCGAASIGQAHKAVLRRNDGDNNKTANQPRQQQGSNEGDQVIIKIQYPDAAWQVPADIQCVADLVRVCIWTGFLDESAAQISFDDFARQFSSELDYAAEARHLQETYESSTTLTVPSQGKNPYLQHGVVVPRTYPELCTSKVITMSYLEGPKLEQEARKQLESLGIDTSKGLGNLVRAAARQQSENGVQEPDLSDNPAWKAQLGERIGQWVGVDTAFWVVRNTRRLWVWSGALTAQALGLVAPALPTSWNKWRQAHLLSYQQSQQLAQTGAWVDALLDVHGYQIFQQGLFNADCHPGNILVLDGGKLGLIDFGQCKRLTLDEQAHVAQLLLSVARDDADEQVAAAFRNLGVKTRGDSTEFLAEMARLMFGKFETKHLKHSYHQRLHQMDRITYFPKELSMVYRTCLLLRGLAISLQINPSVAEHWAEHAQVAADRYNTSKPVNTSKTVTPNASMQRRFVTKIQHIEKEAYPTAS